MVEESNACVLVSQGAPSYRSPHETCEYTKTSVAAYDTGDCVITLTGAGIDDANGIYVKSQRRSSGAPVFVRADADALLFSEEEFRKEIQLEASAPAFHIRRMSYQVHPARAGAVAWVMMILERRRPAS